MFYISAQEKTINFPHDFFGNYTGTLHIYNDKGNTEYPMEFHLQPTSFEKEYTYTIIYGNGEQRQERLYTLKEKDVEKGIYVVDENNGILLENKVINNKLYTLFEVNDSLLTTFITFEEDHLLFEIIFVQTEKKWKSGGTQEKIPEVFSYPIQVIQQATLLKQ
ncbi:hypothetical protein ULMS_24230 [Patiriisocius marinistellae]|uniref:Uncharacterized protein n=1 Tax=Patiriisocius marinistellae TaxID=2494560 RepID=A0A5J4G2Q8_9FLAO|nr:hypothetical protein ULMS_24230 [Patiriisocius marinistellae]